MNNNKKLSVFDNFIIINFYLCCEKMPKDLLQHIVEGVRAK